MYICVQWLPMAEVEEVRAAVQSSDKVLQLRFEIPFPQVGTNGIISFRDPFYFHAPQLFPGIFSDVAGAYLVAPFWGDVDIRRAGNVLYEVMTEGASPEAADLIMEVSNFVSNQTGDDFSGTWMLVAMWDQVHPYPHGILPASHPEVRYYYIFLFPSPSFFPSLPHPSHSSTFTLLHLHAPPSSCSSTLTHLHLRAPPLLAFLFPTTFPSFLPPFLSQANAPFSSAVNVFLCAAVIAYAGEEDQGFICRGRGRFIPR